jgi:hypothetical protein
MSETLQNKRRALKVAITKQVRWEAAARIDSEFGRVEVSALARKRTRQAKAVVDRAIENLVIAAAVETAAAENRTAMIQTLRIDQKRLQTIRDLCNNDRPVRIGPNGGSEWVLETPTKRFYGDSFGDVIDNATKAVYP